MSNTLCPYLVRPLAESSEVNGEHILPSAFGAPDNFTIQADASENQRINIELDAPTINMSALRMIAVSQGVKSRSGDVELKIKGVINKTGEEVNSIFSSDGFKATFRRPVEMDNKTNQVRLVKGMGKDAIRKAEAVKAAYERKGFSVEIGEPTTLVNPTIDHKLDLDLNLLNRMMVKTGYLMTVRQFGDSAIKGKSGSIYRSALIARDAEAMAGTGIGGASFGSQVPWFLPTPRSVGHSLSCFRMGGMIISSVTLFGIFHAFFITPSDEISESDLDGEIIYIDPATSTLSSIPYAESVIGLLDRLQDNLHLNS